MFERYVHHDQEVSVRSDLKGKHWAYCLCGSCARFKPDGENCRRSDRLFKLCRDEDMVCPVWECPDFEAKEEA
jgi:hypothetical protein